MTKDTIDIIPKKGIRIELAEPLPIDSDERQFREHVKSNLSDICIVEGTLEILEQGEKMRNNNWNKIIGE